MIIDYVKGVNASPDDQIRTLSESVQRAFDGTSANLKSIETQIEDGFKVTNELKRTADENSLILKGVKDDLDKTTEVTNQLKQTLQENVASVEKLEKDSDSLKRTTNTLRQTASFTSSLIDEVTETAEGIQRQYTEFYQDYETFKFTVGEEVQGAASTATEFIEEIGLDGMKLRRLVDGVEHPSSVTLDNTGMEVAVNGETVAIYGSSTTMFGGDNQMSVTGSGMELKKKTGAPIFKAASVAEDTEISERYSGTSFVISNDFKTAKVVSESFRNGGLEKGMYADLGTLSDIDWPLDGVWINEDGTETALQWNYDPLTRTFTPGFAAVYSVEGTSIYKNALEFNGEPVTPFKITSHDSDLITIASGAQGGDTFVVRLPGKSIYTPVGIVSFAVKNGSGSGCSYATFSQLTVGPAPGLEAVKNMGQVDFRIRAVGGKITNCTLTVCVLWQAI